MYPYALRTIPSVCFPQARSALFVQQITDAQVSAAFFPHHLFHMTNPLVHLPAVPQEPNLPEHRSVLILFVSFQPICTEIKTFFLSPDILPYAAP